MTILDIVHHKQTASIFPSHIQDKTISSLKKKNQELEKLKFVLDFQLNELKKQTEPQQDDINEKKERIHQVCVCVYDGKRFLPAFYSTEYSHVKQ